MIKFQEDYFIIQDEESCAFLFRKEDVEKYTKIENIKQISQDSEQKFIILGEHNRPLFYFENSSEKQKYFSIFEGYNDNIKTIFTLEIK